MKNPFVKIFAGLALASLSLGCAKLGTNEGESELNESQAVTVAQGVPIEEKVQMPPEEVGVYTRENPVATQAMRSRLQERGINVDVRPGVTAQARALLAKKPLDQSVVYEALVADACSCKSRTCYVDVAYAYNAWAPMATFVPELEPKSIELRRKARACHDALPIL